jgi:MoaA/NifB/PqqE/SkfB family radical SAM enzyme
MLKHVELISLELTNACNFDCAFCTNHVMTRKKGFMDKELAKRLIREAREHNFTGQVTTNVMGEPLLHKDLLEILDYANSIGQPVTVITNGGLLNTEISLRLLRNPSVSLGISYHSNDEASFLSRRSSLTYEQYRKKIHELIELKFREKTRTRIHINAFSTANKPHDAFNVLPDKEAIEAFGQDWCSFARSLRKKYALRWHVPVAPFRLMTYLLPDVKLLIHDRYHEWSNVLVPAGARLVPAKTCSCTTIVKQCNILWNGDMAQCCIDYNGDLVYGNVKEESLADAFYSPRARDLRQRYTEGRGGHSKCLACWGHLVGADGNPFYGQESERFFKDVPLNGGDVLFTVFYALRSKGGAAIDVMKRRYFGL